MYCLRCKAHTDTKEKKTMMKGGRYMEGGRCCKCDCKKTRFIKGKKGDDDEPSDDDDDEPSEYPDYPPGHRRHVPPHLIPFVVRNGKVDRAKLKRMILEEHGFTGEGLREILQGSRTLINKGVRGSLESAPPSYVNFITRYGDWIITDASVERQPIKSYIDKALNIISLGQWSRDKDRLGYDQLFHLFMRLTITDPRTRSKKIIFIEKNQRPRIQELAGARAKDVDYIQLYVPRNLTLKKFEQRAHAKAGQSFYLYDGSTNNCQYFVMGLVSANGLKAKDGTDVRAFVKQNTEDLLKGLLARVGRTITDLAGAAQVIQEGGAYGFPKYADYLRTL